jgi:glutathione S-transferase
MRLIGMLDSPYVRRVAIALQLLDIPFEHDPLSVFSTFEQFSQVNPVVKAPTLVCDDGLVLMDSGLIIDYLEAIAGRSLWPAALAQRARALRVTGLALAACEKIVQIVYEQHLRPAEKQHAPWLARVRKQMMAALTALDEEIAQHPLASDARGLTQAGLSAAIVWRFMQIKLELPVADTTCPALSAHATRCAALPAFANTPADETVNVSTPGYSIPCTR